VRNEVECRRVEERLSDHLEGALDSVVDAEVRAHIEGCEPCRELRGAMSEVIEALRDAPDMEPSADLAARAASAALRAGRARRPRRIGLPTFTGLPPWVLATAAVLALALSTGLVTASGGKGPLGHTGRLAQRVSAVGIYIAEKKDRLAEDVRMLRGVVGTAFEGRVDRVSDRVEDYKKLLERRQREELLERGRQAPGAGAPAPSAPSAAPANPAGVERSEPAPTRARK
jgi:hypothetical protein